MVDPTTLYNPPHTKTQKTMTTCNMSNKVEGLEAQYTSLQVELKNHDIHNKEQIE